MSCDLFARFTTERLYLKNITPKTLQWYEESWRAFAKYLPSEVTATDLNQAIINETVIKMRQAGLGARSASTYCCAVNAFLRWLHEEGHAPELLKTPKQKELT